MLSFVVNAGVLIWLMGSHRKLKHDVLVALLFGTVKAALIGGLTLAQLGPSMLVVVIVNALVRGLFSFLSCWAFLALLGRTERVEFEHRKACASGSMAKKPALVLEYVAMTITGIACLFS